MAQIKVMLSAAFKEPYLVLVPQFEHATGHKVESLWVATAQMEIAFQQMSELLPVPGIDLVGPLPPDVQEITTFSTGVPVRASEPEAAPALVAHFKAPAAIPVIRKWGMEPA